MQPQPQQIQVQKFKAYPSIENHYRDKFIEHIIDQGYDHQDIIWVASEKIHGSNFSAHVFDKIVKYGRRSDFITKDIPIPCQNPGEYFNQAFYDARNLVKKFHNGLGEVWNRLKKDNPELVRFSLFGQYFGGNWPQKHPNYIKGGPKHVQKGIYYTPQHQFMAFDIFVYTNDKAFWIDVLDIPKYLGEEVKCVPVYTKGTFKQVFGVDIKIDSTIPQVLGLPKIQNNLIEGMVVRPNSNLRTKHNDRVIIKKKNAEFSQIATGGGKQKKQNKQKVVDPQIAPFIEELDKYLNENRVSSCISKFPDEKDRTKIKKEIINDIMIDAAKNDYQAPPTAEVVKKVELEMGKRVMQALNDYYKKK